MASTELSIVLRAKDEASKVFKQFNTSLEKAGWSAEKLSRTAKVAGTAITGLGVALGGSAVKSAMQFEQALSDVNTLFDDNGESIKVLDKGIKNLLKVTPKTADDLGASAYAIVSAGISDATEALKVLDAAQKLAVAGLGETSEATDIVTSAINAFGRSADEAESISNTFFLAVKSGKTTVSELAQGFGQVAPLANELGVGFEDLISTVSAMTTSGLKASVAYSQVRAALANLAKPTKEMQDAFDEIGYSANDIDKLLSEKGLTGTFRILSDAVGGNKEQLARMFGSVEGLNAVLMLLNETGDEQIGILEGMKDQTEALTIANEKQKQTAEAQYAILKNNLNVAMIELGNQILPTLIPLVQKLTTFIQGLNPNILKWGLGLSLIIGPTLLILGFLPNLISGLKLLAVVIKGVATAFMWLAANPVGVVIIALAALGVAIYALVKNWDWLKEHTIQQWELLKNFISSSIEFIKSIFSGFASVMKEIWSVLWEWIKLYFFDRWGFIQKAIEIFGPHIKKIWEKMKETLSTAWNALWEPIVQATNSVWDGIKSKVESVVNWVKEKIDWIKNAWSDVKNAVGGIFGGSSTPVPQMTPMASGGIVTRPTPALVGEAGPEAIIPLNRMGSLGNNIVVNINGGTYLSEEVSEQIGNQIIDKLKSNIRI